MLVGKEDTEGKVGEAPIQLAVSAVPSFAAVPGLVQEDAAPTGTSVALLRGKIWDQRCQLAEQEQQLRRAFAGRYDTRCRLAEVSSELDDTCRSQQAADARAEGLSQALSEQQVQHQLSIGLLLAENEGLRCSLAQLAQQRDFEQQQQLAVVTMALEYQQLAEARATETAEACNQCALQQQALDYMQQQQASSETMLQQQSSQILSLVASRNRLAGLVESAADAFVMVSNFCKLAPEFHIDRHAGILNAFPGHDVHLRAVCIPMPPVRMKFSIIQPDTAC